MSEEVIPVLTEEEANRYYPLSIVHELAIRGIPGSQGYDRHAGDDRVPHVTTGHPLPYVANHAFRRAMLRQWR
jgi:hypothetical protein